MGRFDRDSAAGHDSDNASSGSIASEKSTAVGSASSVQDSMIRSSSAVAPTAASQALTHDAGQPEQVIALIEQPPATRLHRPKLRDRPFALSIPVALNPRDRTDRSAA